MDNSPAAYRAFTRTRSIESWWRRQFSPTCRLSHATRSCLRMELHVSGSCVRQRRQQGPGGLPRLQPSADPAGCPALLVVEHKEPFALVDDDEIAVRYMRRV